MTSMIRGMNRYGFNGDTRDVRQGIEQANDICGFV